MLLKTKVKVGNVTNLSDARYCAGMGVDLIGFPIGNGHGRITPEVFHDIAEWIVGPEFVLEYSDTMDDNQLEKVTQLPALQHIQLTYSQLCQLRNKINNKSVILLTNESEWAKIMDQVKNDPIVYLILEEQKDQIPWKRVESINSKIPVLIPYALLASEQIDRLPISGIILEGTSEDKPGQKDYDHLSSVLESLEIE